MKLCSTRIQHIANPLHVYCRLIDFGVSSKFSRKLSVIYEKYFYQHLLKDTKHLWNSARKESL